MTVSKDSETFINLSSLEGIKEHHSGTDRPEDYDGIRLKRMLAYAVDFICIFLIGIVASTVAVFMGIITLGLLTPILALGLAMIPLAYHTLTIGSQWHATLGMRLFNIEVCLKNGDYPDYITAFFHAGIFYLTIAITSSLVLLISLFNPRGSLLHDYLTNSIVRQQRSSRGDL
ncbi:MAG: RDD family protein [Sneathiella sp.]|nr:RDD family protein [Sneathiella sp.]